MVSQLNKHSAIQEAATLAQLREAFELVFALQKPYDEFGSILKTIDWESQSAEFFRAVVSMVTSLGGQSLAHELAVKGSTLYPSDKYLGHMAYVMAPGKVIGRSPAVNRSDSMKWLEAHADAYRGLWVAVNQGVLISTAPSLKELLDQIGPSKKPTFLIAQIP